LHAAVEHTTGSAATTWKIARATLRRVNLNNSMVKMLIGHKAQFTLQMAEQEKAKMQKS
jgi:hypothetical protein